MDGGMIPLEVVGKGNQFLDSASVRPGEPAIQGVGMAITNHPPEGISQVSELVEFGLKVAQTLQVGLILDTE